VIKYLRSRRGWQRGGWKMTKRWLALLSQRTSVGGIPIPKERRQRLKWVRPFVDLNSSGSKEDRRKKRELTKTDERLTSGTILLAGKSCWGGCGCPCPHCEVFFSSAVCTVGASEWQWFDSPFKPGLELISVSGWIVYSIPFLSGENNIATLRT